MGNKGLWILLVLTVLAVGGASFEYWWSQKREQRREAEAKLVPWKIEEVQSIEFVKFEVRSGADRHSRRLKLSRSDGLWRIEEPILDAAAEEPVLRFLREILDSRSFESVAKGSDISWGIFGLDQPIGEINLMNNVAERLSFKVASRRNFQGDSFIRRQEDQEVLLASSNWFFWVDKATDEFREKRPFRGSLNELKRFSIKRGEGKAHEYLLEDGQWIYAQNREWKLDQNKIREYLQLPTQQVITEFVRERGFAESELSAFGLQRPSVVLELGFSGEEPSWVLKLGQDASKQNYILPSDPRLVAKINVSDANKLLSFNPDGFRDRKVPFEFEKPKVRELKISQGSDSSHFKKSSGQWQLVVATQENLQVDSNRVQKLIDGIHRLEVSEFLDQDRGVQLSKPTEIKLFSEQGEELFWVRVGEKTSSLKSGLPARTSLWKNLISLDSSDVEALDFQALLKGTAKTQLSPTPEVKD